MKDRIRVAEILRHNGIGVIPTDTLYGIAAPAFSREAVERLYQVRKRNPDKPFIILLADGKEIEHFGISAEKGIGKVAQGYWPGKVSVVLALPDEASREKFAYLHRGTNTLAFRVPDDDRVCEFVKISGPLAAPSANPEGKLPALTIGEAKKYFGENVDGYLDGGMRQSEPSTLIEIRSSKILILREGAVREIVKVGARE